MEISLISLLPIEINNEIINYLNCYDKINLKLVSIYFNNNFIIKCFILKYYDLHACCIHEKNTNLIDAIIKLKNAKNIKNIKYLHFINSRSLKIAFKYLWHFGFIKRICFNGTGVIYNNKKNNNI